jgi:hypothetical protein
MPASNGLSIRRLPFGRWPARSLALALALSGAGCASLSTTDTGFLPNSAQLEAHAGDAKGVVAFSKSDLKGDGYRSFMVEPVVYRPTAGAKPLDDAAAAQLTQAYHDKLVAAFARRWTETSTPGPGVLRVRAAVTDVRAAQPVVNFVAMAAIFTPVTAGGASTEAEVVDGQSGDRLAALRSHTTFGDNFRGGPFRYLTTYGQARRSFAKQADALCELIPER